MVNSTIITVSSLLCLIAIGSTAAYYLARTHSRLSYGMYLLFLLGIVLPFQLALVPLYRFMKDTGLLGSYTSMVLFYTGLQIPFTIFLYTGFLRALPREYGEAALVDGATHWQSFTRVTFPLLRPITGTVLILNAVFIWNDFLTPLVYLGGTPNETLPVVVYQFVGQYVSNWGYIFAAVVDGLAAHPDRLPAHAALRHQGLRQRTERMTMRAIELRCEHREDIPCIDHPAPRFSWALEGGARQTAYRIRVGEEWDSGRVETLADASTWSTRGRPCRRLPSWTGASRCGRARPRRVSEPARFRTGPAAWTAEWIARDPVHDPGVPVPGELQDAGDDDAMLRRLPPCGYFRRRFTARGVRRATLYATARGVYELAVNGERVGDAVLAPGWTDYRERIEYAVHDVTELLREGENELGAILGDGWFAGMVGNAPRQAGNHYGREPQLLCQLHLEHARRRQRDHRHRRRLGGDDGPAGLLGPADGRALRRAAPDRARGTR